MRCDRLKLLQTILRLSIELTTMWKGKLTAEEKSIQIIKYFTFPNSWTLSMCSYFSGQFQFWKHQNITAPEIGHWIEIQQFLHDWHFLTLVSLKENRLKLLLLLWNWKCCAPIYRSWFDVVVFFSLAPSYSLLELAGSDELLHRWPITLENGFDWWIM